MTKVEENTSKKEFNNLLMQISINTGEHLSVQVINEPKGSEAAQTSQTG